MGYMALTSARPARGGARGDCAGDPERAKRVHPLRRAPGLAPPPVVFPLLISPPSPRHQTALNCADGPRSRRGAAATTRRWSTSTAARSGAGRPARTRLSCADTQGSALTEVLTRRAQNAVVTPRVTGPASGPAAPCARRRSGTRRWRCGRGQTGPHSAGTPRPPPSPTASRSSVRPRRE
jgi:hypothetical protein